MFKVGLYAVIHVLFILIYYYKNKRIIVKITKIVLAFGGAWFFSAAVYAETSPEALFETKCASCHVKMRPNDISTLVAPPLMGVMRHVKMAYGTRNEAVKFISEYALNPQESKAVCMPQKIKHFGLMPSQKGNVTQEELTTIAGWMYDNFAHQGQGHGKGFCRACKDK